jgi:hypothetical protein
MVVLRLNIQPDKIRNRHPGYGVLVGSIIQSPFTGFDNQAARQQLLLGFLDSVV